MRNFLTLFIVVCCFQLSFSQNEENRIRTIENQLEVLKVETSGLEEKLNINITQTTLSNFLLAISEIHGLNINVSPELNQIQIINNFSNVQVRDVLIFLVKEYDLTIDFTGNILSIKKFVDEPKKPEEKEILAIYNPSSKLLSLDLKKDRLDKVFRKIMDISGKNLLFSQPIENLPLTLYLNDVPFDIALDKLAVSNNLVLNTTRDGFYVFDAAFSSAPSGSDVQAQTRPVRRRSANFYYKVLDTLNRRIEVDLQNTQISDVIYTIGEDLNLDIFTASPLDQAGTATVKAQEISFDLLLEKIFQSADNSSTVNSNNPNSGNSLLNFTYKKDGNVYYFGTEDQLSLKQVELITMMHRSVQLLENPSGGGQRRAGRSSFNPNNFINSGFNSGFNQGRNNGNLNNNASNRSSQGNSNLSSIEDIIPEDVKEGLDIKIDPELNSFIVSGPGVKVERFKDFLNYIDKPVPVLLIEVMIVEVNRSTVTETGISFGIGDAPRTTQGELFPNANVSLGAQDVNKIIGNFNGFGSLNIGKVVPNFYLDIKAMEADGTLKIKSTPKLTTLNGHKAFLSSGETTYYAVTTQNFIGNQNPINSEIRNYVPIDADLSLEILPFVSGDGEITLDIQVIQSAFNGERIAEDAPPGITSREFSSIVRMRDQDVAVLGGIESIRRDNSGSGVPFLARIPVIKWLFSKRRREATDRTLNILIKPTVID